MNNSKFRIILGFAHFLERVKNTANLEKGVDIIVKFRNAVPQQVCGITAPAMNDALKEIEDKKYKDGLKEQSEYIK